MSTQTWKFIEYIKALNGKDILLSSRFKSNEKIITTKWTLSEQWKNNYKVEPNYRQVLSFEIVLEKDYPKPEDNRIDADKIIKKLETNNINYWCDFTGSKSYHIHLLCPDLKKLEEHITPDAKKSIVKKFLGEELYQGIDEANFYNKRLIQIEFSTNPKTGKQSEPYKDKNNGNYIELTNIEKELKSIKIKKQNVNYPEWKKDLCPKNCAALEYCFNNNVFKEQSNKTRHHYIAPSMACYIRHKPNRNELATKYYVAQQKNSGELESWDSLQTYFSCNRIRQYFKDIGLEDMCIKCLLEGDLHG